MGEAFTIAEVQSFADVIAACQRGARVRWLDPSGEEVREGTMRHVCRDASGSFLRADEDVRSAVVRITASTGFEVFVPLPVFADWSTLGYVSFES